jgi:RNA polymerase sigma-70 factor (family 1)
MSAENAFKELFNKEYNNLCRYALFYLQDSHWAEDVVQETFVKFWEQQKIAPDRPEAKFYLITSVRNNSLSALRKQSSNKVIYSEQNPEPEPEPFITTRQIMEDAGERSAKIAAALDQLPPKCREVFLLVKMHGMSYKQAAESLDLSVKTIEHQMGKAIKIMRDYTAVLLALLFLYLKKILSEQGVFY